MSQGFCENCHKHTEQLFDYQSPKTNAWYVFCKVCKAKMLKFKCVECPQGYSTPLGLKIHVGKKHEKRSSR